jgi:hypothetical protein
VGGAVLWKGGGGVEEWCWGCWSVAAGSRSYGGRERATSVWTQVLKWFGWEGVDRIYVSDGKIVGSMNFASYLYVVIVNLWS